jgi:hypothetical protein
MTIHLGNVPADSTLYIPFHTFSSAGASVTISNFAVTDIEIYKNGSTTQRASDNGYTLLDTDGIDFDSLTGIHGFSIDLSDNSHSGFYSVGASYWVVVSSITANGQTVNMVAATFRIVAADPASAGAEMTLSSGERDAVAAALLDLAAGVETNRTLRQALRLMLAALCGKASGLATATAIYRDTNDSVDRITATVDADGNRSAITLNAG